MVETLAAVLYALGRESELDALLMPDPPSTFDRSHTPIPAPACAPMTLPLPAGASVRISLVEGAGPPTFRCAIARASDGRIACEWSPEALARRDVAGVNLAGRQVPLLSGVHLVGKPELRGLPGFLYDSLPDAWGRLLTDRALRKLGIAVAQLAGIDRLAVVGDRGIGALVYAPQFLLGDDSREPLDLDRCGRRRPDPRWRGHRTPRRARAPRR